MPNIITKNQFPSGASKKKLEEYSSKVKDFVGISDNIQLTLPSYPLIKNGYIYTSTTSYKSPISDMFSTSSTSTEKCHLYFPCKEDGTEVTYSYDFLNSKFNTPKYYDIDISDLNVDDPYSTDMLISVSISHGNWTGDYKCIMYYNGTSHTIEHIMVHQALPAQTAVDGHQYFSWPSDNGSYADSYVQNGFRSSIIHSSYNGNTRGDVTYDTSRFQYVYVSGSTTTTDMSSMTKNHILIPVDAENNYVSRYKSSNSKVNCYKVVEMTLIRTISIPIDNPISTNGVLKIGDFFIGESFAYKWSGDSVYNPTITETCSLLDGGESNISIQLLPVDSSASSAVALFAAFRENYKEVNVFAFDRIPNLDKYTGSASGTSLFSKYLENTDIDLILHIQDSVFGQNELSYNDVIRSATKYYSGKHLPPNIVAAINDTTDDRYFVFTNSDGHLFRFMKYDGQVYDGKIFNVLEKPSM